MKVIDRFDVAVGDNKEFTDAYEDMIDEISGEVVIGSLHYNASMVLREIDPIAFRCGFDDWIDTLDTSAFGGRYECGECGNTYADENEAEECCKEPESE